MIKKYLYLKMQNVDKLKNPINRDSGEEKAKCGKKAAVVSGSSGQSLSDSELDKRGAEGIDERIPGFMHCMLGGSGSDSSDVSPVSIGAPNAANSNASFFP